MKAVVAAFNQEKALVGAFSVITNLRMQLFEALLITPSTGGRHGDMLAGQTRPATTSHPSPLALLPAHLAWPAELELWITARAGVRRQRGHKQ